MAIAVAACGGDGSDDLNPLAGADDVRPQQSETESQPPPRYRPLAAEEYPAGKRIAATIAQRATTYPASSSPAAVAESLGAGSGGHIRALAAAVDPLVDPEARSTGEVIYPQLSGVTPTTLGVMVAVRQTLEKDDSAVSVVRVIDVRLILANGRWVLDEIGDVGGEQVERPAELSPGATRLLSDPGVELTDSARWDIYRGGVDDALLATLADAGRRFDFTIGILASGHPEYVWGTSRVSAHSTGYAADIYEVGGRPVIEQRQPGSPAYRLATLLAPQAAQLGSPWAFGGGSFTDAVHQDHLHLQRSPSP